MFTPGGSVMFLSVLLQMFWLAHPLRLRFMPLNPTDRKKRRGKGFVESFQQKLVLVVKHNCYSFTL